MAMYRIIAAVIQVIEVELTIDMAAAARNARTPGEAIRQALLPEPLAIEHPGVLLIKPDGQLRVALKSVLHADSGRVARSLNRPWISEDDVGDDSRHAPDCANCGWPQPISCSERDWRCLRCCPVHGTGGHPEAAEIRTREVDSAGGSDSSPGAKKTDIGERSSGTPVLRVVTRTASAAAMPDEGGAPRRFRRRTVAANQHRRRSSGRRRAAA